MPRYIYGCTECEEQNELTHGIFEKPEIICECGVAMIKLPSMPLSLPNKRVVEKVGDVVKSSIEEFKKDLKEQQKDASKQEV